MNRRGLLQLIGAGLAEPYVRRAYSFIWAPPERKVWVYQTALRKRVVIGEGAHGWIGEGAHGWFVEYSYAALDQEGRILR